VYFINMSGFYDQRSSELLATANNYSQNLNSITQQNLQSKIGYVGNLKQMAETTTQTLATGKADSIAKAVQDHMEKMGNEFGLDMSVHGLGKPVLNYVSKKAKNYAASRVAKAKEALKNKIEDPNKTESTTSEKPSKPSAEEPDDSIEFEDMSQPIVAPAPAPAPAQPVAQPDTPQQPLQNIEEDDDSLFRQFPRDRPAPKQAEDDDEDDAEDDDTPGAKAPAKYSPEDFAEVEDDENLFTSTTNPLRPADKQQDFPEVDQSELDDGSLQDKLFPNPQAEQTEPPELPEPPAQPKVPDQQFDDPLRQSAPEPQPANIPEPNVSETETDASSIEDDMEARSKAASEALSGETESITTNISELGESLTAKASAAIGEITGSDVIGGLGGFLGLAGDFLGPVMAGYGLYEAAKGAAEAQKNANDDPYAAVQTLIAQGQTKMKGLDADIQSDQFAEKVSGTRAPAFGSLAAPVFSTQSLTGMSQHF